MSRLWLSPPRIVALDRSRRRPRHPESLALRACPRRDPRKPAPRCFWLPALLAGLANACQLPPGLPASPAHKGHGLEGPFLGAGARHTCAIFAAGAVRCWGDNGFGQLGRTADDHPLGEYSVDLGKGQRATGIYVGLYNSCAVLEGGTVKCWGENDAGQLGLGDTITRGDGTAAMGDALSPVDLGTGRRAMALAVGGTATCALLEDGAVKCWGDPYQGATGYGDIWTRGGHPGTMGDNLPTVDLGGRDGSPFRARAIAAFDYHSFCAILDDTGPDNSGLKCWGSNDYCELGLGTDDSGRGSTPETIGNRLEWVDLGTTATGSQRKATALGGGYQSTCVLGDDGAVSCWGMNESGQLGRGEPGAARSCRPGEVGNANLLPLPGPAVALAARGHGQGGGAHACVVLATGAMSCWGENGAGQLGTGDTTPIALPSPPLAFPDGFVPKEVVLGSEHSCAISLDRRVKCWGANGHGQLGPEGSDSRLAPGPDLRLRGRPVLALSGREDQTCAILEGGALKCWGRNDSGQLGLGDFRDRGGAPGEMGANLPPVDLGGGIVAVAVGAAHTCAVAADGAVRCWGANDAGQLGRGAGAPVPFSQAVALPGPATSVVAGSDYSCALLADNQVICWGAGAHGQLGTGALVDRSAPDRAVPLAARASRIAGGARHVCALLESGRIACWGGNGSGQLGQGDRTDRAGPSLVETGIGRVLSLAAGGSTTCVVLDGGIARCWGANDRGQLGLGDVAPRALPDLRPIALGSGRVASALSVGGAFACALLDTMQAKCWGDNRDLQLGAPITAAAYGDGPNEMGDFLPAAAQGGGRSLRSIVVGRAHACALLDTGDVRCWGDNRHGQLGAGDRNSHSALVDPTGVVDLG